MIERPRTPIDVRVDGSELSNDGLGGFARRAFLRAQGVAAGTVRRRPVIGICTSWSELNPCNMGLRDLATGVKRGVVAAGGQAYEFPTISLAEQFVFPSSMILRNLMAMDVEEMIARSPLDGVVLLGGCDKTVPAQLMGAASAGRPAIMLTAGPRPTSRFRGQPLVVDDFWTLAAERQMGRVTDREWTDLEGSLCSGMGVCNVLGTATTMAVMAEALGMALPGSALLGAHDARRAALAEETGARAVALANAGVVPADVLTTGAFDNAMRVLLATGGSTNAVIHLEALAGRVGLRLGLDRLDRLAAETPLLAWVRPSGPFLLDDWESAGGVPALLKHLTPLLDLAAVDARGETLEHALAAVEVSPAECLRPLSQPFEPAGGLAAVRGTLAPNGALIKRSAAASHLRDHEGPALVFESPAESMARAASPDLDVPDDTVLVVRNAGPLGGPGMPEIGQIPIPLALRRRGVKDMVCITDGRISGTQAGAVVIHTAPESDAGGPLGLVRNGDVVRIAVSSGELDLDVNESELARRSESSPPPRPVPPRGYARLYHRHVLQADEGCDFDFLRHPALNA